VPEILDGGVRCARTREGLEKQSHTFLHLLVWVDHDVPASVVNEANRQVATQLTPARFV